MFVLITYDVETSTCDGRKRLRRIARQCVNFGQRVQNSVFECNLDYGQFLSLKNRFVKEMDSQNDSLRFYILGNNWANKVEHYGKTPEYSQDDVLII